MSSPALAQERHIGPIIAAVPLTLLAAMGAALATGAGRPLQLQDPGDLVRWGIPAVGSLSNLAAALSVGSLLLAYYAIPRAGQLKPSWDATVRIGSISACAWAIFQLVLLVLTYARTSGQMLGDAGFASDLGVFLFEIDVGRYLLIQLLISAAAAATALASRSTKALGYALVLMTSGLTAKTLTGHAASGTGSQLFASASLLMHLLGAAAWLGGMITLAFISRKIMQSDSLARVVTRYSTLALLSYILVTLGGVASAWLLLNSPADLFTTSYGLIIVMKSALLIILGAIGWWHRRFVISHLEGSPGHNSRRLFWRLIGWEILILGIATGLGATLAGSAPPQELHALMALG